MTERSIKAEAFLIQLPEDVDNHLQVISRIDGSTLDALILEGALRVIQARKADPEFIARASTVMLGVYQSALDNMTREEAFEPLASPE